MLYIALILLLAVSSQSDAVASKLDGSQIAGQLVRWSDGTLTLEGTNGPVAIPEQDLLSLTSGSVAASTGPPTMMLELVDGSKLPISRYMAQSDEVSVQWDERVPGDLPEVRIPLKKIAAVRLRPFSRQAEKQWSEIRALALPSDILVVTKGNEEHFDYVEGLVGDVTDSHVRFAMDGDEVAVSRTKLAGVIYYREPLESGEPIVLEGKHGLSAKVSHVALNGDMLELTTVAGVKLQWPLEDLRSVDFSAGKIFYLGDIEPVASRWKPWVGSPSGASLAATYGRPLRDRSLLGGSLTLLPRPGENAAPAKTSYSRGLSLHSQTELAYRVPRGFHRFSAVVGIDPAADSLAHVVLTIRGDQRILFESEIAAGDHPQAIDLDVASVDQFEIIVDYGRNLDRGDVLNVCDAKFVK